MINNNAIFLLVSHHVSLSYLATVVKIDVAVVEVDAPHVVRNRLTISNNSSVVGRRHSDPRDIE